MNGHSVKPLLQFREPLPVDPDGSVVLTAPARPAAANRIPHKQHRLAPHVMQTLCFRLEKAVDTVAGDDDVKPLIAQVMDIGMPLALAPGARPLGHGNGVSLHDFSVRVYRVLVRRYQPRRIKIIPVREIAHRQLLNEARH